MKKTVIFLFFLILAVNVSSGQATLKETRNVSGFTKVIFGVSGNLFIRQGSEYRLEIEGPRSVLDEIDTEVSGGRLLIKRDVWRFTFRDEKVTINITMPELEGLSVSGSGNAEVYEFKNLDDFELNVSGSGKILVNNLNADDLVCVISGSGDIFLKGEGSADRAEISISGSGSFRGEEVEIDNIEAKLSGSGTCYCKAGDSLEAMVSGSGSVFYSGNPRVDARVSGSGRVRQR